MQEGLGLQKYIDKDEYVRLKGALDIATEKIVSDYADVYELLTGC
ncbi:MAG: hypothetical protein ACLR7D_10645 [Lachnospira eligens]